jgi:hypothetical protein
VAECPWEALRDPTLPDGAKTVLTALWRRAGASGRFVWPSPETLATDCGMKPRTLRKHLATLRDREWLSRSTAADGRRGWTLCDPPGVAVHTADEPDSEHERHEDAGTSVPSSGKNVPNERHGRAEDSNVPARPCQENGTSVPPLLYRNQRHEPTVVRGAESPPPSRSLGVNAWRSEFVFAWRGQFDADARGCRISDPTSGAHRLVELQRMLDEHGGDVVRDVLLHAAERVVRHHETNGEHGLHPRMLAVTFRADKPQAFDALLDAWQADTRRKRHTGKTPAAPAEIDGVSLTDEEQRMWILTDGGDAERQAAIRAHREVQEARALVARSAIGDLLGGAA